MQIESTAWGDELILNPAVDQEHERIREEPSLAEWIRRLGQGEEEAWRWFHGRYYLLLLRSAAARTGDPSAASEIVQLTYLRVARHVRPFAQEQDFLAWLACVLRCVAVDYGRHTTRRSALLERFAHGRALSAPAEPDPHYLDRDDSTLAEEALARLPDAEACLLRRRYYEGYSLEELARDTGITPKAMENRLARLRQRLRNIILRIQ